MKRRERMIKPTNFQLFQQQFCGLKSITIPFISSQSKLVTMKSTLKKRSPAEQSAAAEVEIVGVEVGAEVLVETRVEAVVEAVDKLAEAAVEDLGRVTAADLERVLAMQAQGLDLAGDRAAVGTAEVAAGNTNSLVSR